MKRPISLSWSILILSSIGAVIGGILSYEVYQVMSYPAATLIVTPNERAEAAGTPDVLDKE